MNKHIEIEDMAKIIAQSVDEETLCDGLSGDSSMACLGCDYSEKEYCKHNLESATGLYNKGYRKTSAVASEIFEELETVLYKITKPIIRADGILETKIMDGLHIRIEDYNAIRKKYESEGADDEKVADE